MLILRSKTSFIKAIKTKAPPKGSILANKREF